MDEAELSQILKEAFRLYGYQIAEAFNVPPPLHPLLKNEPALVQIALRRNQLQINPFDLDAFTAEIRDLKETVSSQKTEIKSLSILLEHQAKQEEKAQDADSMSEITSDEDLLIDEKPEKKKHKRKQK